MHQSKCQWIHADHSDWSSENEQFENVMSEQNSPFAQDVHDSIEDHDPPPDILPQATSEQQQQCIQDIATSLVYFANVIGEKPVTALINLLQSSDFCITQFRQTIHDFQSCKNIENERIGRNLAHFNFASTTIQHSSWTGTMFMRNARDVIQSQVAVTHSTQLFVRPNPLYQKHTSSLRASPVAIQAHNEMRDRILNSPYAHRWNEDPSDVVPQSFVGLIQFYSDKSASSLKSHSTMAHPAHTTLLNIDTPVRNRLIAQGLTIASFFPCQLSSIPGNGVQTDVSRLNYISRSEKLHIFQNCVRLHFRDLEEYQLCGFDVKTSDGRSFRCHPVLVSIVSDIPEGKQLTSTKSTVHTAHPCTRCYISNEDLINNVQAEQRHLFETIHIRRTGTPEILKSVSLLPVPSFLENTPLLLSNTDYNILHFEPLHNLHLGISHILKNCTLLYLDSLGSRRMTLLRHLNSLLVNYQKDSYVVGLHIDFRTGDKSRGLNGFFVSDGIRGMLEGKDYWAIDQVFPYLAVAIDRYMGNITSHPLTKIHTLYTELVQYLYNNSTHMAQTSMSRYEEIAQRISSFKHIVRSVFVGESGRPLNSLKFHLLDHVAHDIHSFSALQHMDAGLYEAAHKHFKREISRTSGRKSSVTAEVLSKMQTSLLQRHLRFEDAPGIQTSFAPSNASDGLVLTKSGQTTTFRELCRILPIVQQHFQYSGLLPTPECIQQLQNVCPPVPLQVAIQIGDQGLQILLDQLQTEYPSSDDITILIVKSGFVMGGFIPESTDINLRSSTLHMNRPFNNVPQRVIACNSFGASQRAVYSDVLVSGDGKPWVAKARLLLRATPITNGVSGTQNQLAFVQYYEYVRPIDAAAKYLRVVHLRWSTDDEHDHTHANIEYHDGAQLPSPWYGLEPAGSIMGVVHVLRTNYPYTDRDRERLWFQQRFCVNRFYTPSVS